MAEMWSTIQFNPIQFNPKVIRYDPIRSVVARSRLASVKYFGLFADGCLFFSFYFVFRPAAAAAA